MDAKTAEMREPSEAIDRGVVFTVLWATSLCHLLNDLVQSLVPAIYPLLKQAYALDFAQIGVITLAFQCTASVLQPLVGIYTDRRPTPFSLPIAMGFTLAGLVLLAAAGSYGAIILGAALVGVGSAVFHPEASRVARMASGGRHGFAQAVFQVGGNCGTALGPLLAAFIIVPRGQGSISWFTIVVLLAMTILYTVGRWYRAQLLQSAGKPRGAPPASPLSRRQIGFAIVVLIVVLFSKNFYTAAFTSYYTFYLIHHFGISVSDAQLCLFAFLAASAVGVYLGGPIGDRFGHKVVIWGSILGVLPFTLALPYADLGWTIGLSIVIGLILSSSFPQVIVFGQQLLPGRVGLVSGLFLGLAFGLGGLGAAVLGELADRTSIEFVYTVCSYLPALGIVAILLPNLHRGRIAR